MIDYEHIPPHLRLSDRHLIVADYPGGAEWWRREEDRATMCRTDQIRGTVRSGGAHEIMLAMLRDGPKYATEIGRAIGATNHAKVDRLADGLTHLVPIYEIRQGKHLVYGLAV